jgi:hypothetical protein
MPKPANEVATLQITISVPVQMGWYLDRLIEKGLFGTSRAQAAATVIADHCKLLIGQGRLSEAPLQSVEGEKTVRNV